MLWIFLFLNCGSKAFYKRLFKTNTINFLNKKSIGIVGFGPFAQFIAPHLKQYFEIWAWNRSDQSKIAQELGVRYVSLKEVLSQEIIILCTSANFFEDFLVENSLYINPNALVIDVASIKMRPTELMLKYLPSTCKIIGTHPLFGPQSGKYGIKGLNMVICPVRGDVWRILAFLERVLKLNVMVRTPEEHDKEMAYVQALTHFVGRALSQMQIPDLEQKTKAYQHLLDIKMLLGNDSFELFKVIENHNPYAKEVRESFISELASLEKKLL